MSDSEGVALKCILYIRHYLRLQFKWGVDVKKLPLPIQAGELARLIPVVKDTCLEDRASSILLAIFRAVPAFSAVMLKSIGQRVGAQSKISCYTQIVLADPPDGKLRPDGLIRIERGGKVWTALVEAKIGNAALDKDQILAYIDLAKSNGIDALITVSNDFATLPTFHPIAFGKREQKGIELFHWSWLHAVTQGTLIQQSDELQDDNQKFILDEFLRYFEHDSVGIKGFHQMNAEWKQVIQDVLNGAPLKKTAPEIEHTINAWHQESRDLCMIMSRALGVSVKEQLARHHVKNPEQRCKDDAEHLVDIHELLCTLDIPDSADVIKIKVDLQRRSICCSMRLEAPQNTKTNKPQITWLLKQLSEASDQNIHVRAWHKKAQTPTQANLAEVRKCPQCLVSEGKRKVLFSRFEVSMVHDLAGKFSGSKLFIKSLEEFVPYFYEQVGQHVQAWVAPPPKAQTKDVFEDVAKIA